MKRIEILMSAYNGDKFIEEQIESIMRQRDVDVHLTIRDDGSSDETVSVIKKMQEKYPNAISVHVGENIGYRKSFLRLLDLAVDADYYGFADQDDFWKEEKSFRAVECLEKEKPSIKLYVGSLKIVDSDMKEIADKDISGIPNTLGSLFTRNRFAGCTFVFSKACKEMAQRFASMDYAAERMPDHDFLVAACAYAGGSVVLDDQENIFHIRHSGSVTSGGNGLKKRIRIEWNYVFNRKEVASTMAGELIHNCEDLMDRETTLFLEELANYKKTWKRRLKLLRNNKMKTGMSICDWETRIKILLGTY